MGISQAILAQLKHEGSTTRKLLERLPPEKLAWKPHEKSMTLGRLASHLAELPGWASIVLDRSEFDVAPAGGTPTRGANLGSREEILNVFDDNLKKAAEVLAAASDEAMKETWSFKRSGAVMFALPRNAVFQSFILSHSIHHRGQLSVYLRLQDVPLPSIYGPSADEGM